MENNFSFPKDFLWGSSTSAHQVEGGNHNDWNEWEAQSAKFKAESAKSKVWPDFILRNYPNPLQEENYISGRACDHYNRFHDDFDIAKSLGHNAHRFSIEWSRIEPEEGKFDEKEIEHYREVIRSLRERGMEPFVTLWHWTHPVWFAKRGGWLHPQAEVSFLRFVERVVSEYKTDVRYWITLNEPETFVRYGYLFGSQPPGSKNFFSALKVLKKLVEVHKSTYNLIHDLGGDKNVVGFAEGLVFFETYNRLPQNVILKYALEFLRNMLFVPKVADTSDFIGLNYYFHSRVRLNPFVSQRWFQFNENKQVSDLGWEIYPEGLYRMLLSLKHYQKPIFITENGIADARDHYRAGFIRGHIQAVERAIHDGVDVQGYFYWSLLDNFEIPRVDGFWPRFGLVEVDYKTLERKIRPSAYEYKKIIEALKGEMGLM